MTVTKKIKYSCLLIIFNILILTSVSYAKTFKCYSSTCNGKEYSETEVEVRNRPDGSQAVYCKVCGELVTPLEHDEEIRDPNKLLSDEEILKKYSGINGMVADICSIGNETSNPDSILNTDAMIKKAFSSSVDALVAFEKTSLHSLFVAVGIFILVINFLISIFQNTLNKEHKTLEQIIKLLLQFTVSLIIVWNVNGFLKFFLSFFGWILENVISFKNSSTGFSIEEINSLAINDKLTIALIRSDNLDNKGVLAEVFDSLASLELRIKILVPWIISVVGKFGMLFIIIKSSIEIIVYGMLYPMAAGDCYENIKQSRFMRYSRHIMGCILQISVVVLILFASSLLINGFVNQIFGDLEQYATYQTGASAKVFESVVLLGVIQLSRMVVAGSASSAIAHKVFGD